MATRIGVANGVYDLSKISNLKELREEIDFLKTSLKTDEKDLEERLHQLPHKALVASADAVLPSFINKMIANGSWKILTSGIGMLANPFSKKLSFSKNILGGAKKLGLLAAAKGAFNLWRNKSENKKKITTVKTRPLPVAVKPPVAPAKPTK